MSKSPPPAVTSSSTLSPSWVLMGVILLSSSLGQVTSDLYLPSLPAIARGLNVSEHASQLTISIYMIGFCLAPWLYGPLSDRTGRRAPLLLGLLAATIASILCGLSPTITFLFTGRLIQGLGAGAGVVLSRALLRDLFAAEKLAQYSSYMTLSTVGILTIAPMLGGHIQFYGEWRYNFAFLSVYALFILILCYYYIPDTRCLPSLTKRFSITKLISDTQSLLKDSTFLRFTLSASLTYAGVLAWLTATPIVLQTKVGMTSIALNSLYLTSGLGFGTGSLLNAKRVTQYGIEKMLTIGLLCQLSSGLLMCFFYLLGYINAYVIIAPISLFMLGSGLVFPNASAGALTPFPDKAGTGSALFTFVQILGGVLASSVIAVLHDDNQLPMGIVLIITASIALYLFRLLKLR